MAEQPRDTDAPPAGRRTQGLLVAALVLATVSAVSAASTGGSSGGGAAVLRDASAAGEAAGAVDLTVPPAGAVTLPAAPVLVAAPEPADAPVITGLAANGIPNVALNAYRVAATRMTATRPGCGLDWSLLAGIGRVESNHGRYGGAVLNDDGTSTPQIIGPPLDGVQFAFISDSDGGQWDGDRSYDRAVGPMQFIPGTWRSYGVDGDGDGDEQPTDIDDAALAAASYLCVAGGDLTTDAGRRRALLAYNHSDSYVDQVLALAAAYAAGIPVADLPLVGDTTSPVPAPSGAGSGPAAPGPAIGAGDSTPSRPGQPTVLPGQPAPAAAGSEPQPAGAPAGEPPASGGGGTGAGSGSGSGTGSGAGSGPGAGSGGGSGSSAGGQQVPPAPAPPSAPALPPAPQPVPVPLPLPTIDVPVPAPLPVPLPICLPNVLPSLQQGCVPG